MTTEKRSLNIIIVGGGLAGLAAAGYLRAQHNVTVSAFRALSAQFAYAHRNLGARTVAT